MKFSHKLCWAGTALLLAYATMTVPSYLSSWLYITPPKTVDINPAAEDFFMAWGLTIYFLMSVGYYTLLTIREPKK